MNKIIEFVKKPFVWISALVVFVLGLIGGIFAVFTKRK